MESHQNTQSIQSRIEQLLETLNKTSMRDLAEFAIRADNGIESIKNVAGDKSTRRNLMMNTIAKPKEAESNILTEIIKQILSLAEFSGREIVATKSIKKLGELIDNKKINTKQIVEILNKDDDPSKTMTKSSESQDHEEKNSVLKKLHDFIITADEDKLKKMTDELAELVAKDRIRQKEILEPSAQDRTEWQTRSMANIKLESANIYNAIAKLTFILRKLEEYDQYFDENNKPFPTARLLDFTNSMQEKLNNEQFSKLPGFNPNPFGLDSDEFDFYSEYNGKKVELTNLEMEVNEQYSKKDQPDKNQAEKLTKMLRLNKYLTDGENQFNAIEEKIKAQQAMRRKVEDEITGAIEKKITNIGIEVERIKEIKNIKADKSTIDAEVSKYKNAVRKSTENAKATRSSPVPSQESLSRSSSPTPHRASPLLDSSSSSPPESRSQSPVPRYSPLPENSSSPQLNRSSPLFRPPSRHDRSTSPGPTRPDQEPKDSKTVDVPNPIFKLLNPKKK